MNDLAHSEEYRGYTLKIHYDQDPESPREWSNLSIIACYHPRYHLGDYNRKGKPQFPSKNEVEEIIGNKSTVWLPLYLYDHSGITMNTTGFSCPWDSGQVGWIYATKEVLDKEYGKGKWKREEVERVLKGEVEVYDQFLTGQVYGYTIEDEEGDEIDDSCWGLYGEDYAISEAKSVIDYQITKKEKDAVAWKNDNQLEMAL